MSIPRFWTLDSIAYSANAGSTANALKPDPSPSGPLDRFLMRWKCFNCQQPAFSGQSERSWHVLMRSSRVSRTLHRRARHSFRRRHRAYAPIALPCMRADAVLMLLLIIKSSSRDSARSLSTAFNSQRPTAQRPVGSGREISLRWLLATGCWLLEHFGRRPPRGQVPGETGRPRGEPRDAQTRRAERAAAGQVGLRRNQREAKGTRMGRRQAAKADGGGIGREEDFKATASNPRGLDARAFTKKTGAPDECALDTS